MSTPGLIKAYKAASAVAARRLVALDGNGDVVQASATTDAIIGVSELGADAGKTCDVIHSDIADVEFGGAVSPGDFVTADADGKAVAAAPASGVNARVAGTAIMDAVAGDIRPVLLNPTQIQGA